MAHTTGRAAKLASIAPTTVRVWTAEYAEFFSDQATPPKGKQRAYTSDDIALLLTIAELRNEQMPEEAIHEELRSGRRAAYEELPADTAVDQQRQLAVVTQLSYDLAQTRGERDTIATERDRLLTDLDKERDARLAAEIRATAAETEVKLLRERDEEEPAASEQKRSFWSRWRIRRPSRGPGG